MTFEAVYVSVIAGALLVALITEVARIDKVAIAVPVLLLVGGVIDAPTAVSGLSSSATIAVGGFLVVGLAFDKTGVIRALGRHACRLRAGGPTIRLLLLCLVVAAVSPFTSNTAVVAVFLPVFAAVASHAGQSPSRYLMPLSFVAILSGTLTVIGTSTNLVVHDLARARGFDELTLFSITPLGAIYLGVGLTYLFTVGRLLLPDRPTCDVGGKLAERLYTSELTVTDDSRCIGRSHAELDWTERYGLRAMRPLHRWHAWLPFQRALAAGDVIAVIGSADAIFDCARSERLDPPFALPDGDEGGARATGEVLVAPDALLAGRTLRELRFGSRFRVTVLGIQRAPRPITERLGDVRLRGGDLLLLHGPPEAIARVADHAAFVPIAELPHPALERGHGAWAVGILAAAVAAMTAGWLPIAGAAMCAAVAVVFARCVRLDEIYRELDWPVLAMLAGLLPLGAALDDSGVATALGRSLGGVLGGAEPWLAVGVFYLVTSLLTELMSNQAAAVVLTPIAITTAASVEMNPNAFIVAVMFGASASFMTPFGYQTNLLVFGPGGYRVRDYLRVGAPLNLLLAVVAAIAIPRMWP